MEVEEISQLITLLRAYNKPSSSVFTISANLLAAVLSSLENLEPESPSTSFHVHQTSSLKSETIRDLHFLYNFIQTVLSLKIYSDSSTYPLLDLSNFKSLKALELSKIDANYIRGLQKLRSQVQKIACNRTANTLEEVLSDCGGDKSSNSNCWSDLKEASFVHNEIVQLDSSLECTPLLHTLDLSHNQLTNIDALNCLSNLKHLNLSYNRLESVPQFRGQICSRLQNLTLKGNFIENIAGLQSLVNLWVLDLCNNCLVDHKSLISISHMATLQSLHLDSNPLSFHPNHRMRSASYLHINTGSTRFVLDSVVLSKSEKKVIGTLHPIQSKSFSSLAHDSANLGNDKLKKIRHVTIEDQTWAKPPVSPIVTPSGHQQHLETKRRIEDLRQQYGDSWLKLSLGTSIDDVLGLERAPLPLSSSPYEADFLLHSGSYRQEPNSYKSDTKLEKIHDEDIANKTDDSFITAFDTTADLAKDVVVVVDDMDLRGVEVMFMASMMSPKGVSEDIFLVITRIHITESDSLTSTERERWDLASITSCKILEDREHTVQLDFETMRRDRKQRIYVLMPTEIDKFLELVNQRIKERVPEKRHTDYQCMKCSLHFARVRKESVLDEPVIKCPTCDSNLVVESL